MFDKLIVEFDKILKSLTIAPSSVRAYPDETVAESEMSLAQKRHSLGLMRINHCGEVCAQALYQAQELLAKDHSNAKQLKDAAAEEIEHLAWTKRRITELGGRTSVLNPLFYAGSFALGVVAGALGDSWSMAFLEETEAQVEKHLTKHLDELPIIDLKSRAIVRQMREDEIKHKEMAHELGSNNMPVVVRKLMRVMSQVMTKSTYYL